jgi:predicted SPOUT superfamily RNA methylase MTH1
VSPTEPVGNGLYWGYTTRVATSLSEAISACPYKGGYDGVVGVSEAGDDACSESFALPRYEHLLVVFGGLAGLSEAVASDQSLREADPRELFPVLVNACPEQGSRQLRTEENILITLAALQPHVQRFRSAAAALYDAGKEAQ